MWMYWVNLFENDEFLDYFDDLKNEWNNFKAFLFDSISHFEEEKYKEDLEFLNIFIALEIFAWKKGYFSKDISLELKNWIKKNDFLVCKKYIEIWLKAINFFKKNKNIELKELLKESWEYKTFLKNIDDLEKRLKLISTDKECSIKIAIWTKSPPKVAAIEEAIERCIYFKEKNIEIISLKVESWISDMPITIEENMDWAKNRAKNRAKNCKKEIDADFYVWMEWWVNIFLEKAYLFWVVYILDKNWKWHFGMSNMMEVPEFFRQKIYDEGQELWPVLSEVTKEENASKKWWAFWHWSDDMLTRKDQFILAFLSWIVPFFNKYYK